MSHKLRSLKDKRDVTHDYEFWEWQKRRLRQALLPGFEDAMQLGIEVGMEQTGTYGSNRKAAIGIDWDLVNIDALEWASLFTDGMLEQITQTTHRGVGAIIASWMESGDPFGALVDRLSDPSRFPYGKTRAQLIASTEVTRAYYQANVQTWKNSGVVDLHGWETAADDKVCVICAPLQGVTAKIGEEFEHPGGMGRYTPPAHPRCRCWAVPVVGEAAGAEAEAQLVPGFQPADLRENILREAAQDKEQVSVLHEERDQLRQELGNLSDVFGADHARHVEIMDRLQVIAEREYDLRDGMRDRIHSLLEADRPSMFRYSFSYSAEEHMEREVWEEALDRLRSVFFEGTIDDVNVTIKLTDRSRAYAQTRSLWLNDMSGERAVWHEMGHIIEAQNAEISARVQAFLEERCAGEEWNWLGDNFDPHEVTRRDRFINPYMGKQYSGGQTEILSMGLDLLADDPLKLAREDPGYFEFIVGILRGMW